MAVNKEVASNIVLRDITDIDNAISTRTQLKQALTLLDYVKCKAVFTGAIVTHEGKIYTREKNGNETVRVADRNWTYIQIVKTLTASDVIDGIIRLQSTARLEAVNVCVSLANRGYAVETKVSSSNQEPVVVYNFSKKEDGEDKEIKCISYTGVPAVEKFVNQHIFDAGDYPEYHMYMRALDRVFFYVGQGDDGRIANTFPPGAASKYGLSVFFERIWS